MFIVYGNFEIIMNDFLKENKNGVVITVKLIPNSSKNCVLGYSNDYLKVKITAQAIENKANKQLILFLSEIFNIPKTSISFLAGEKSKEKRLLILGARLSDINEKISVYDRINS